MEFHMVSFKLEFFLYLLCILKVLPLLTNVHVKPSDLSATDD